ncbi:MAG TPA: TetR/AcrR family transcriptional regulator [Pseudonocardia sp.]|nr:TetR/AcrR family transcriptional regulator [Pseudonocardia sp.]
MPAARVTPMSGSQADTVSVAAAPGERLSKGARTRLRILDAGAHVLRTRGYAETRLSDIAEVAGLQTGSLAFHFPSKTELLEEVLRHGFEAGLDMVRSKVEALGPDADPVSRLGAAVSAHLTALEERADYAPALLRTMDQFPPENRHRLRDLDHGYVGYWRELLEAAQTAGQVPGDLDPAVLSRLVLGAMNSTLGQPGLAPRGKVTHTILRMLGLSDPARSG